MHFMLAVQTPHNFFMTDHNFCFVKHVPTQAVSGVFLVSRLPPLTFNRSLVNLHKNAMIMLMYKIRLNHSHEILKVYHPWMWKKYFLIFFFSSGKDIANGMNLT